MSSLLQTLDEKVYEQLTNVATLPGIVNAAYAMPDAHWGYGFPIGGVAAFDPDEGGVISAGGVGFDISCGVRAIHTGLTKQDIQAVKQKLADKLARDIPAVQPHPITGIDVNILILKPPSHRGLDQIPIWEKDHRWLHKIEQTTKQPHRDHYRDSSTNHDCSHYCPGLSLL